MAGGGIAMSVTDQQRPEAALDLDELPGFDLSYLFDNADDPTEVTVFPASNDQDISTNWITVDLGTAVPLEQVR